MASVRTPQWLSPPRRKWLECRVEGLIEPEGYAIQVRVNGHDVTAVIPKDAIDLGANQPPTDGRLQVLVVAELPEGNLLAELPAPPVNGTQRIVVPVERLTD